MKSKSLKLLLKGTKIELERLSLQLGRLNQEIQELQERKEALHTALVQLEEEPPPTLHALVHRQTFIAQQRQELAQVDRELELLFQRQKELKEELHQHYAKKEALQRLLDKLHKEQLRLETMKENNLADESFLRRYTRG
ncbi:MAG: hypothetical protein C6I00_05070 [Nitratiruptor sp.]|nr:hypothetical protein [Nitratiruptor sp.]NPA84282.1 DUF342 domain-containing protein [Campylobacterota bacterium]